jgi:hypothetical protein
LSRAQRLRNRLADSFNTSRSNPVPVSYSNRIQPMIVKD